MYTNKPVTLNQDPRTTEIPYVYLGGRGYYGNTFTEVDAGFQFATDENNWAAWLKVGPVIVNEGIRARYDPSKQINISFDVPADNNVRLTIHGPSLTPGIPDPYILRYPARGFNANGSRNVLKRVTSIAQVDSTTGAEVTRADTGAFFPVGWINTKLGLSPTSFHGWGQWDNDINPRDNCVNPSMSNFKIQGLGSLSDEEIHIDLKPRPPVL